MKSTQFKRISIAITIAALIAGCSSGVKLDDVPVEDKGATSTTGSGAAGTGGAVPPVPAARGKAVWHR